MLKHIYHRVLQLGNDNTQQEAVLVENDEKLSPANDELVIEDEPQVVAPDISEDSTVSVDDDAELDEADDSASAESSDDEAFVGDDDPLAPAYDLEHGKPLKELEEEKNFPGLPVRSSVDSAKEFFNTEFIYRYDLLDEEQRKEKAGKYRFELKGLQGGIWTLVLTDEMEIVNRREDADIVYTMQQKDFVHVVNGDINPQLAILAKKLRITGEMHQAINFLDLIVPGVD